MLTKEEALASLKRLGVKPGDTIWTVLRHRRGNHRRISLLVVRGRDDVKVLDHIAEGLGVGKLRRETRYFDGRPTQHTLEGIATNGGGQDMGFHLVYEFGTHLAKAEGRDGVTRQGGDAGYDFEHRWL